MSKPLDPQELRVIIIAMNEESRIERAVRSGLLVGPVTVIDSGSRDRTRELAVTAGAEVIENPWRGYAAQRRFAIEREEASWIVFLDADEEITPDLAVAIIAADRSSSAPAGYLMRRRSRFLGRWMKHGAWGRDYVLRLFRRTSASVAERLVHEQVSVTGPISQLDGVLLHYSQDDFETVGRKFTAYVPLMAAEIIRKRTSISAFEILARAKLSFIRDFYIRAGFLDSWQGLVLAFWGSASVVAKYAEAKRLLEARDGKQTRSSSTSPDA